MAPLRFSSKLCSLSLVVLCFCTLSLFLFFAPLAAAPLLSPQVQLLSRCLSLLYDAPPFSLAACSSLRSPLPPLLSCLLLLALSFFSLFSSLCPAPALSAHHWLWNPFADRVAGATTRSKEVQFKSITCECDLKKGMSATLTCAGGSTRSAVCCLRARFVLVLACSAVPASRHRWIGPECCFTSECRLRFREDTRY